MATKLKQQAIDTTQIMPIGTILPFAGATAPSQFLLCQGQAISRDDYANLFNVIGTTYGVGDGSSTFNLPNLEGKIPVGKSSETEFNTLGKTGGAKTHTLTTSEMPSHQHSTTWSANPTGLSGYSAGWGGENYIARVKDGSYGAGQISGGTGGGLAHNNLQPYIVLNYIIRY